MLPSHRAGPLTLPIEVQPGQVQPEAQQNDAFYVDRTSADDCNAMADPSTWLCGYHSPLKGKLTDCHQRSSQQTPTALQRYMLVSLWQMLCSSTRATRPRVKAYSYSGKTSPVNRIKKTWSVFCTSCATFAGSYACSLSAGIPLLLRYRSLSNDLHQMRCCKACELHLLPRLAPRVEHCKS